MEFLGRKDRQVKIRGFRVELDEIEHQLGTHPAVEAAAVFPVGLADGTRRIVAAVTLRRSAAADEQQLQAFLTKLCPAYAVPEQIAVLPALPRTATDKIDRRRLQAMAENAEMTT
jgi:acyl-coenzyme A synthetase/AMP-(fatty) acid ligase